MSSSDGDEQEGWRWTSPEGRTFEIPGKWAMKRPPLPRDPSRRADWHMVWRKVSPRNVQLIRGSLPTACPACDRLVAEALLIMYRGEKCCPACFERRKTTIERGMNAAATLAVRARTYMESQMSLGRQNCPEVCP